MRVRSNGIEIEVDDQGPRDGDPVVLLMGLGMQLTAWPDELVQGLVERGHRVVRLDNRDAGLSTGYDHLGVPNLAWMMVRHTIGLTVAAPYTLAEMAADTLGVMDALGITRAHVCGASMGGMIAQHLAADHAARVRSLTLMMTSSGARGLPRPSAQVQRALLTRPADRSREAVVRHFERLFALIGSPAYPPDPARLRQRLEASVARAYRPAGTARQLAAIVADGDRSALLGRIGVPTQVIHGDADVLIPLPAGQDVARKIPGAVLDVVPGMGHDLPLQLLPRFAAAIAGQAARTR
jgi:pimeloyl-ACP methyl ester carboxylesterase